MCACRNKLSYNEEREEDYLRLELEFELKKPELPKDNKSIWISYLKKVLTDCNNGKFFNLYFSDGKMKDYVYSIIFTKPEFLKDKIQLGDTKVKMIFSADDRRKTGLIFYSAFIKNKNVQFRLPNKNIMVLKKINHIYEELITNTKVIFKTITGGGLVIREHDKKRNKDIYYTFEDKNFSEHANNIIRAQALEAGFSQSVSNHINILPIDGKKVLVKQYGVYIDVTVGKFLMEANQDLLQYFYQAGLGSKHSMGYGLIDVVSQIE